VGVVDTSPSVLSSPSEAASSNSTASVNVVVGEKDSRGIPDIVYILVNEPRGAMERG